MTKKCGAHRQVRETIAERIRQLVAGEDPSKPLTDIRLAARLSAEQFAVGYRTVGKFRIRLHIPPASVRQRNVPKMVSM